MLHTEEYELLPNIDDMPSFSSDSDLMRLPYLGECEIDEQMPQAINSRYYTVPEFAEINSNTKQLSILHTNIRSVFLHGDEIVNLCAQTKTFWCYRGSRNLELRAKWNSCWYWQ